MPYEWFSATGIELEYMIVTRDSLDVHPIADTLLDRLSGEAETMEVALGPVVWSNELARHVLEVKTRGPSPDLANAKTVLDAAVNDMNRALAEYGARLLPGGMHPWMMPEREFQLWPTDPEGIYRSFDRIFDCRGHGWSNLQSMHINLPFADDAQFRALHSAVRLLLPILPALSASSPYWEGRRAPVMDQRLSVYQHNAHKLPVVSGRVIPETADSRADYEARILQPIYTALAPFDPEGALRYEWVNARGAIPRFDRMSIEIRVLDTQECPRMDLAIAHLVSQALKGMCQDDRFTQPSLAWPPERLATTLWSCVKDSSTALIEDADYLSLWGLRQARASAQELWAHILEGLPPEAGPARGQLREDASWLIQSGTLAQRLVYSLGASPKRSDLQRVYSRLADCLERGERFDPLSPH